MSGGVEDFEADAVPEQVFRVRTDDGRALSVMEIGGGFQVIAVHGEKNGTFYRTRFRAETLLEVWRLTKGGTGEVVPGARPDGKLNITCAGD